MHISIITNRAYKSFYKAAQSRKAKTTPIQERGEVSSNFKVKHYTKSKTYSNTTE